MDIQLLITQAINTSGTLAQIAASLFIAIAVFSGEQVATALKGQQPQIRINPRRYIEYLNLREAGAALALLALLQPLYAANIFPDINAPAVKAWIGLAIFIILLGWIYFIIDDTLVHRRIEKKFKSMSGSISRLIAWNLSSEEATEQLKLITVLFERTNDTSLEQFMLKILERHTDALLKHPGQKRDLVPDLLSALRALRTNLDKRPVDNIEYYQELFELSHVTWYRVFLVRKKLHEKKIFQISGALGSIGKMLLRKSIIDYLLFYDYAMNLEPFLSTDTTRRKDYLKTIGRDLPQLLGASAYYRDFSNDDYIMNLFKYVPGLKSALNNPN